MNYVLSLMIGLMFISVSPAGVLAQVGTMRRTAITSGEATLIEAGGVVRFRKRVGPETLWNLQFTKDGVLIAKKESGGKDGPLLGINAKTKQLALFDAPGPTTTWQVIPAGDSAIRPPRPFKALLYMKLDEEELRLSSDEEGNATLGGKADILMFLVEGA